MSVRRQNLETEVKLAFHGPPEAARALIERKGYAEKAPRVLESDQLFDRPDGQLRGSDRLLRLRRSGARSTVTYKGPSQRERYKSREEVEFDVSDADAFALVLDRLGYAPTFRYQKCRTKFAAPDEPGEITIDETPIGVFLELEGEAQWIDRTAERLGFSAADYCTASYASLYRDYRSAHPGAGENMIFEPDAPC